MNAKIRAPVAGAVSLAAASLLAGTACLAATPPTEAQHAPGPIEEVIVYAHPLSAEGLAQPSTVLEGEALQRKTATNIGDTLGHEPGIHVAPFGTAVGRPVIHGLGGPRVRVMEDRIDTLDVSVTSPDHAVTVEPFIAERIEVLKGSGALLYGTGAIGGVVDVHTGRIPHEIPERPVSGGVETRFNTNTDGNATSAKLNGGAGKVAWHLDGTWKDGNDYEIPGVAESRRLRALERAEGTADANASSDHDDGTSDRLPGSAFEFQSYAGGASYVGDWGFVGASIGELRGDYGLPGGHGDEEAGGGNGVAASTPTLDMEQTRIDVELGVDEPFGPFTSLNVRVGVNDYEHQEIEPGGEVATDVSNEAWEARAELAWESGQWTGAAGLQHSDRRFSASGEEAFVPPVDSRDTGTFLIAQRAFEEFDLETGLRLGRVKHEPEAGPNAEFTTFASSIGVVVPMGATWELGLIADYSSRAPVGEELYSNGAHLAIGAVELGDPDLDSERAANATATLRYDDETWRAVVTAYYTHFDDFIYEQDTGAEQNGLPVLQFQQQDADFFGIDAELTVRFAEWDAGHLAMRGMFDFVEAELDVAGNDNLPRIPPLRFGVGLEAQAGIFTGSIEYTRVTRQDAVTDRELVTDGYDDLRAYLAADFELGRSTVGIFVSGRNLTDDEQRHHTSFIKEFAPAPGHTIEAGVRVLF